MSAIDALMQTPQKTRPTLPPHADRARLRKAQGLTQGQVAEALEVSVSAVSAWETPGRWGPRGKTRELYSELLHRIAARLGESTEWEGTDDDQD